MKSTPLETIVEFCSGERYRQLALDVARDLLYKKDTIEQIRNAKSDQEISRILSRARNGE